MGALTTFLFGFSEGAILIGASPNFLEHWAIPHRSTSLHRRLQNKNKYAQFIHMRVELWANHMR
jgi:hypothetical protein